MNSMIRIVAAGMAIMSLSAFADEFSPSDVAWLVTSMSDSKPSAFPGANKWQIDGADAPLDTAPHDAQDYGVKSGKYLRPPVGTSTFAGRSLSVGAADFSSQGKLLFRTPDNPSDTTFSNEGLFLYRGEVGSWNGRKSTIRGKVRVNSKTTAPVNFFISGSGGAFDFHSEFIGDSDTGIWFHSRLDSGNQSQTHLKCAFFGDSFSAFNGTLTFAKYGFGTTKSQSSNDGYQITFSPDAGAFPGTLDLYPGANVMPVAATSDFTVANMVLRDGPHTLGVMLSTDRTTSSCVRVTSTLTWPSSFSQPVVVRIVDEPYPTSLGITNAAQCLVVFQAPAGTTLNSGDFVLEARDETIPHLPTYALEVSGNTVSLVRQSGSVVVQTVNENSGNVNAFTGQAAHWSNNAIPKSGNDYLVKGYHMRTDTSAGTRKFNGDSLSLSSGATLNVRCGGVNVGDLRVFGTATVNNLGNTGSGESFAPDVSNVFALQGSVKMTGDPSTQNFKILAFAKKAWNISAEISGNGLLYCYAEPQNNVTPSGRFGLFGLNTNFSGRISVDCSSPTKSGDRFSRIYINDARNLGGPCAAWTYNALAIGNYSELHPLATLTLDEPTRGIAMGGANAAFVVSEDVVFTCKERITYNGVMVKKGAGELALGGQRPYFGADGTTTPTANKNVLDIREGVLRPVSAAAFQGLAVVITNGATLVMDVPVSNTDGDIGQYGMLNTACDAPFTVPESGMTVQLRDPNGLLAESTRSRRVPICTVNATARAALDGKLSVATPPSSRHCVKSAGWTENQDGSHTYSIVLGTGIIISIF